MAGSFLRRFALAALLAGSPRPAPAQDASCPAPMKRAAGACVRTCPAGYEDRGSVCVYRSLSR